MTKWLIKWTLAVGVCVTTHLDTCRCSCFLMPYARFMGTLPFQQTVSLMCWIYHSHDDAPKTVAWPPSPVNANPNHSSTYHSPAPDFTPISPPPLPTPLHMRNNSEDDIQVLDFAELISARTVMFLLPRHRCGYFPQYPALTSYKETVWLRSVTDNVNFLPRQINIIGKRRATVMTFFFNGSGKASAAGQFCCLPPSLWMAVGRHGISQ